MSVFLFLLIATTTAVNEFADTSKVSQMFDDGSIVYIHY